MPDDLLPHLQTYFTGAFPERQGACVRDLVSINSGWESDVYAFTAEWGQPPQHEDLILRIYPGNDALEKSQKEYRALKLLHQAGYPVPRVDRLELHPAPFGKPFLIMERIQGRGMWGPLFHSTPSNYQRLLPLFCGLFARLHALDWRTLVDDPRAADTSDPYAPIDRQLAQWEQFVERLPGSGGGFQASWDWLNAHKHDSPSAGPVVAHWDFHPENLLLKPDGSAVVIDWTGVELTDYRFDLAWTLLLIGANDSWALREPVLREYERQAGHAVEGLEFFEAAACLRRMVSVLASIMMGAETLGMRPGAEQIMRKQAPSLRNVYEHHLMLTGIPIEEFEGFLRECGV